MAQTLCIKCGSELKVSSYCHLCQVPLIFACTSCDYISEEKVHTDCRNANVLAKTEEKEETIFDKPKEDTVKAEPSSTPYHMTREQAKKNFNNPFIVGTVVWQTLMKYWLDAYGEFLKNVPKMTQDWYDTF